MSLKVCPLPIEKPKEWVRVSHNLVLFIPSGIYYVRKSKKGKGKLFLTTGLNKKKAAQTMADEMLSDWMGGRRMAHEMSVSHVCDELLEVLRKEFLNGDRRERTFEHDRTYFPIIKRYFGIYLITQIDEEFWDGWIRSTGRSANRTLGDVAKYLSKLLTFAYQKKYINRKPRIKNPDKQKKSGMIYENADIENFIKHSDPMLRDLIIIAAECGLRPHENLGLKWDWITIEDDRVIISIPDDFSKTGAGRSLIASPNASQLLRLRYLKRVGPYVFPGRKNKKKAPQSISKLHVSRLWREMLVRAEFTSGVKFHWLRHSFFSKALLDAKLPLAAVAQYGGNSPAILMKKYLQDDPSRTKAVGMAVSLDLSKCEKSVR